MRANGGYMVRDVAGTEGGTPTNRVLGGIYTPGGVPPGYTRKSITTILASLRVSKGV